VTGKHSTIELKALGQWWRTYGKCARGGMHSPLCGHRHRHSNAEFVTR